MTSYISLLSKIEAFCNAHLQIKKYGGEFREQMPNFATKDEKYPVVFVTPTSDTEALNTNQFTVDIYCVDLIQADRANLNSIISDCQLILKDMYVYYTNDNDVEIDVVGTASMTPLNNQDLDYVAGWVMSITFEVASYGDCAIPMNPIEPNPPIVCADATQIIINSEGTQLYVNNIPSGATETQLITDSVVNLKDTASNLIGTLVVPAQTNPGIIAPNALLHIKKENDGAITNLSLLSNSNTQYIVNNNDISVNGVLAFDIHATESLDVRLRNTSNGTVTPVSVNKTGNYATIVLPNSTIEVNGTTEGTVVAGSTVDVITNIVPTSSTLVGNVLDLQFPASSGLDSDAERFLTATGVSSPTIITAVNNFVVGAKDNGLWYKMDFLYPFIGGTSTSTKFNMKNPIDTDDAFRITWNGGMTFTNGALSNGANGFGNTHFTPSINAGNNNTSIGYKSTTNLFASAMEMGAFNSQRRFAIFNFDDTQYVDMYGFNAGFGRVVISAPDTRGVYVASRTASNVLKLYRNGAQIGATATGVEGVVAEIPFKLYVGALNNAGTAQFFCARNLTFAFSGSGLTDSDVSNLTTLINAFDTAIGR